MSTILLTQVEREHSSAQMTEYQTFLTELGRRLRLAREGAGLSVTELGERAGVSRRYVTQAEAGRANLSVLKLAELARALRTPLAPLVDVPLASRHPERLALVGLRGAGKSTVGRALAQTLEVPFVELDARVEELAGLSLSAIFHLHGPDGFHRFEAEALERVLAEGERMVIATGGSIVSSPETFARLREACHTVWLRARPADHLQRVAAQGDLRPMLGRPRAMEELERLLAARTPEYTRCALTVETTEKSVAAIVAEIAERTRAA